MGRYTPAKPTKPNSVADALNQAEEDHFLDCPTADLPTRAASLLLDVILFSIAFSGINQCVVAVDGYVLNAGIIHSADSAGWLEKTRHLILWVAFTLKASTIYFYFFWSVFKYGGTPAKLLMGLRVLVQQSGKNLSPRQALLREGIMKPLAIATVIGIAMPAMRKDGKALHDLATGTVVKRVHGSL